MSWIAQEYEGEVHVVPDHDTPLATHELSSACWCGPVQTSPDVPGLWSHRDEVARLALT